MKTRGRNGRTRSIGREAAFVTGAGSGIGKAIVLALSKAGARVAVSDINEVAAQAVADQAGAGATAHRLDVTNAAETATVLDAAAKSLGGLDIVCANAGVSTMNRVVDLTEKEWDFNMDVNAKESS